MIRKMHDHLCFMLMVKKKVKTHAIGGGVGGETFL